MGDEMSFLAFGHWSKSARQARHLTQKELAQQMKYEVSLIRKVETGQRSPSQEFRQRLAIALELPLTAIPDPNALTYTNIHIPDENDTNPEPGPLFAGSYLPLRPNPLFAGRTDLLQKLAQAFTTRRTICVGQIAAATGLGGMGKTQLAVEFAHRYGRFFPGGVFWLNFADAAAIPAEIARCGRAAHLNLSPDYDQLPQEQQVALVQRAWQENIPRLLIFDNCEEESLLDQWRPTTGGCHVLVTSRCQRWDPVLGVTHLVVDTLPRAESIFLLRHFVPDITHSEADAIAEALGDLPLALHLAGSYLGLDEVTLSPQGYLQQLQTQGRLRHTSLQTGHLSPTRHENNLTQTFALSLRRLDTGCPVDRLALDLLARSACFAPGQPIPVALLTATVAAQELAETALTRLEQLGLVTAGDNHTIRLHQLIAEFVQEWGGEGEGIAAAAAVAQTLLQLTTQGNTSRQLYPARDWQVHLRYVTETWLARANEMGAALGQTLGSHLWLCGDYQEARRYLEIALTIRRQILGHDHPDVAMTLDSLGRTWQALSENEKARACHEEALVIRQREYGDQHPLTAESHNSLGLVYQMMGNFPVARRHLEEAVSSRCVLLGPTHIDTGFSYYCLALQYNLEGMYDKAIDWAEEALEIAQTHYRHNHPDTVRIIHGLGMFHQHMSNYASAHLYYQQALKARTQLLGPQHNDTLTTMNNLGGLLRDMGHFSEAEQLIEQVLAIRETKFGPNHYATAQSLYHLSIVYLETGAYEKAFLRLECTLNTYTAVFGPAYAQTAFPLTGLGLLHHRLGNLPQALSYFQQALAIRVEKLGEQHLQTAITLTHLGDVYTDIGEFAAAAAYLAQARNSLIHSPHPNPRFLAQNSHAQGRLQEAIGEMRLARDLYTHALTLRQEYLGSDHPHARQSQQALQKLNATCKQKQNSLSTAMATIVDPNGGNA